MSQAPYAVSASARASSEACSGLQILCWVGLSFLIGVARGPVIDLLALWRQRWVSGAHRAATALESSPPEVTSPRRPPLLSDCS